MEPWRSRRRLWEGAWAVDLPKMAVVIVNSVTASSNCGHGADADQDGGGPDQDEVGQDAEDGPGGRADGWGGWHGH